MSEVTKKTATKKDLEQENEILRQKMSKIEAMLEKLMSGEKAVVEQTPTKPLQPFTDTYEDVDVNDIPMTKQIKIMSLFNGGMTLFSQSKGTGKRIRFNKFGDVRTVLYQDLIDYISNHYRYFSDKGYCVILNKEVVKAQGLDSYYEQLLTAKQIEGILDYPIEEMKIMLAKTTINILNTIANQTVFKIIDGKSVDSAKIAEISKIYGRDLFDVASMLKEARPKE